jgi:hypothetical protein
MGSKSSFLRKVLTLSLVLISFSIVLTSVSINSPWPRMEVGQASPGTTYYVDPSSVVDSTLTPGNTFTVDVKITDASYLYSWQVYMTWDGAVLGYSSHVFGGFLSDQPEGSSVSQRTEPDFVILGEATIGQHAGKTAAEGLLFSITLEVLATGETDLAIDHATLTYYIEIFNPPISEKITDFPKENGYFSNTAAPQWTLTVNSDPISGIDFTVDGSPHTTPWSDTLSEGSHTIVMPSTWGIYDFVEWEDASTNPTRIVSLTSDKTVTAYYEAREWTLTVESDPVSGVDFTVDGSPHTTSWSDTLDEGSYTVVMPSVWTVGEDSYNFDHWEDMSTDPTRIISLTADKTAIAYYALSIPQYELIIGVVGSGSTIPSPGTYLYDAGTEASVAALPDPGWMLDHWELDDFDVGDADPYNLIMNANHTLTAFFAEIPLQYELTVNSDPISSVDFTVDGSPHTTPWSDTLDEGSYTVVMPSTWGIYDFVEWEDASTNPTRIVSLTADTTITAYYAAQEWTLTVESDPISGIDFTVDGTPHTTSWSDDLVEGSHTVVMPSVWTAGEDVYDFDHWEDASTDPTRIISLTSNTAITAYYSLAPVAETVVAVDPSISTADPDQYFTINVTLADVTNLYSWGLRIKWSAGLLSTHKDNVTEGPFLKLGGSTSFTKKVYASYLDVGGTLIGAVPGVTGSGTLVTITFKVLKGGNCTLELDPTKAKLYDTSFNLIDRTLQDGYFYTNCPVAKFTYTPHPIEYYGQPIVGETITFDGTLSYDPDEPYDATPGGILSYEWDFGDGNTGTGGTPTHVYDEPGSYIVTLNVTDDEGKWGFINKDVGGSPSVRVQLHDIAVINVTVTPTTFTPGAVLTINVTVLNNGTETEYLNVTVYKDSDPVKTVTFLHKVGMQWKTSLLPDQNGTTTIEWDTTGISPGDYTLKVYAFLIKPTTKESVPGIEESAALSDNWMTYGTITVLGPDFELTASPTSLSIQQGSSNTSTITITSLNDFNNLVSLSVSGVPSEVTVMFDPEQVTPPPNGTVNSTLTVSVGLAATPGSYTLTINATSGTLEHSVDIALEIIELPPTQYQLTINSDPISGVDFTVDGSPHTTSWSDSLDEGSYTVVMPSVWTVGEDSYNFDHWEDASTTPTRIVSLTADTTITAYYVYVPATHSLTVNSDPISGVDFTVDGAPHTTPWSDTLGEGSYTVVMPSSWGLYDFVEWEDASTNPTRIVSLTADKTVTAYYVKRQWTLSVDSDPISGVDFTVDGSPHTTSWSDTLDEGSYTVVMPSVWTVGEDSYNFDHWEDMSTDPTRIISLTADKTVTAYYVLSPPVQYDLTIEVVGSGTTNPPPGVYTDIDEGTDVVVDALPDPGWMLDHWELDGFDVGDASSYTVIMDADHVLTAIFVEIGGDVTPPTITINEPVAKDYLHSETITLDFNAVDTESGVASISATLNGMAVENGDSIMLFTLSLGQHTLTVTAVDHAENSATETVEFNVIATIDSLIGLVEKFYDLGYIDDQGVESGLLDKLYSAQDKIETGKIKTAKNILTAFINHLKAQSGKHIGPEAAYILLTDAQHVIDNL